MNNKFSWQSFISIGLLLSFIIMLISGLVLYIAPEGSLSRWIGWDVLNLTKSQWEKQHTVFSFLFVIFSFLHILLINWDLLISYFVPGKMAFKSYKELIIAFAIILLVFVGTLTNLNPFKFITSLGDEISDSYSEQVQMPKVADAEKLSLGEFADKVFDIDFEELKGILEKLNFDDIKEDAIVLDFCKWNDLTPEELYKIINGQLKKVEAFVNLESSGSAPDILSISSFVGIEKCIL